MPKGESGLSGAGGDLTQAQEKTLRKIIKQTANLKNEQYRIIDENGNVVLLKRGGAHEVAATVGEKRDLMPGAVSIHNHPNGGPFSDADFRDFGFGARQVVVSAPEGAYRLINMRYNTSRRYEGWVAMRDAIREAVKPPESSLVYRKQAQELLKNSREVQAMNRLAKQYLAERKAGASQQRLDQIWSEHQRNEARYKARLRAEERWLEVKPYHDFYRKNAAKYGFRYIAPRMNY